MPDAWYDTRALCAPARLAATSHTSVGRVMSPPGSSGRRTPALCGSVWMPPSSRRSVIPPAVESSVPVNDSTPVPRTWSTLIERSIYFCSSFSALTRSNWKFCSMTLVPVASVSDSKVTVVGSIRAATSVKRTVLRPRASCSSRSCRTTA